MVLDVARTKLMLGLISIVLSGGVVGWALMVANGALSDDYRLTARTARTGFGLDNTSEVKIRGITVGSVAGIDLLDDGTVELKLDIRQGVQIPVDATATIEPLSVFGPKFVDVEPGANETAGPFLEPGDEMGSALEPTELAETLDGVARLLETVDVDDITTIVTELARGVDGLGESIGASIDAANDVAARIQAKQPVIDRLLADARALAATLDARRDAIGDLAVDGQDLLRSIDQRGDALGDLLDEVSELAVRGEDLFTAIGDDLDPTLVGLARGAAVLHEQLRFVGDFADGLDAVSTLLGDGLLQWDRGNGLWGGIGHGIFDFSPCGFVADGNCPPREGYSPS